MGTHSARLVGRSERDRFRRREPLGDLPHQLSVAWGARLKLMIQFVSHVFPPSPEKACSHCGAVPRFQR